MDSSDEEVVISGISGKFPECDNMKEFSEKLYANIDMLSDEERRYPLKYFNLPKLGMLKDITKFDAAFFKIFPLQAKVMDPQMRILLEVVFEAIIDSGNNPDLLRGTNTGVFIGQTGVEYCDSMKNLLDSHTVPLVLTGEAAFYLANRISFSYDFKGPSIALDTGCSSSLTAFDQALKAIKSGTCDRAIVGGSLLMWDAFKSIIFSSVRASSKTGCCKTFDNDADGFIRAEAICVVLLEKKSIAKRIYTTAITSGTNACGYSDIGIIHPSGDMQRHLLESICKEANIDPADIEYIETHGTGTQAGDTEELKGAAKLVCEYKETAVLVGSVKSNMGHSEGASGICSVAKVIIAMENGLIPANLHYKNPNVNIPLLLDGRIKVVNENMPYNNGLVVVSNFGIGGCNSHIVLKPNMEKREEREYLSIPRIVTLSGRTESAVKNFLNNVKETRNSDLIGLVNGIHSTNITGHSYRGYTVAEEFMEISKCTNEKPPVWFIFTGMGSQWRGMGKDLLKIDVFKESIVKCSAALQPHDIDILQAITNESEVNEHILLMIGAISIALVDVLRSVGIHPDGIIGHSMGEIPAAYADDALTLEQAMLCIYYKNKSFFESELPRGIMASVGLSWSEARARCPKGVYATCDNGANNVTIAGPHDEVRQFIKILTAEGIFAREVPSFLETAFHSKYINKAHPILINYLKKVILNPKRYSTRWVCTSVPRDEWDSELAKSCSPEYCAKNMTSPVYFREALALVPDNAVVIEVNPHSIFQTILKQSLPPTCVNIALANRNHPNGVEFFLSSIGKMYISGLQPDVQALYPKMSYPVPRGTPMISPMVEWDHSTSWNVITYTESKKYRHKAVVQVNTSSEKYKFIKGHIVDGRVLFPGTGYVHMVWEVLSIMTFKRMEEYPVVIEDLQLHRATIMPDKADILFRVDILVHSGEFEIHESTALVASGKIHYVNDFKPTLVYPSVVGTSESIILTASDIYKDLRLRGLFYQGLFKGIHSVDYGAWSGELEWIGNWITFTDTMLQFCVIASLTSRVSCVPTGFKKIIIDPTKLNLMSPGDKVPVWFDKDLQVVQSAGIEFHELQMNYISRRMLHSTPLLERYSFVPYDNKESTALNSYEDAISVLLQVFLENIKTLKISLVEIAGSKKAEDLIALKIVTALKREPLIQVTVTEVVDNEEEFSGNECLASISLKLITPNTQNKLTKEEVHILVGSNVLSDPQNTESFFNYAEFIKPGGFILLEELSHVSISGSISGWLTVSNQHYSDTQLVLLKKPVYFIGQIVHISQENFQWMEHLKIALRKSKETNELVYVVSQGEEINGIVGMANCLRKEPGGENVRCIFIPDKTVPQFSLDDLFYEDLLKKDLYMNVFANKCWGSYRHMDLGAIHTKKTEYAYVNTLIPGNMDSLTWVESPHSCYDNLCYVYYAALNFKDVILASGLLPLTVDIASKNCVIGIEFSGCDVNGKRIMGIVDSNAIATTVIPTCFWEVPDKWTLSEASTIPVAYFTAFNGLIVKGQMKKGQTALIHSGAGGVGLAAITIALKMGVTVFTTVGSQEKREFLKSRFSQLTDFYIANSRDESFQQHVVKATNGRGVDLVLNSLTGKLLIASIKCVAKFGKFIEIGKLDLIKNSSLGMSVFLKSITFHAIASYDPVNSTECCEEDLSMICQLIQDGIKSGVVEPLPTTVFSDKEVIEAFRFLGSSKHIGKVLIKIRDGEEEEIVPPRKEVEAFPRIYFCPDKVYIILGGLGGFGLELTNWLISRNAKKIILTSRSGVQNGYQAACLANWKSMNMNIVVLTADCTEEKDVVSVVTEACKLGAIGGIFNLAVVLKDDLFENLTEDDFITCCNPKVNITRHFDNVSRLLCPDLDYFVVFSSLASGKGNQSQSNYGLANSTIERICEKRNADLLPGMAIQWGFIGDVGIVAEIMGGHYLEIQGYYPQSISSCLSALDILLNRPYPIMLSTVIAEKNVISGVSKDNIVSAIAEALGFSNINDINPNSSLSQIGVDSLEIVSLKQTLEREYNLVFSAEEFRDLPIGELQKRASSYKNENQAGSQSQKLLLQKDKNVPEAMMPTQIPNDVFVKLSSSSIEEYKNVNIFMIPPIQGVVTMLEPLASMLPVNVCGLQCTLDAPCDSVHGLAMYYIEKIKTVQTTGPYFVCGYSMGGTVCFEIGIQLEEAGEKVSLIMLDAAIEYSHIIMNTYPEIFKTKEEIIKRDEFAIFAIFLTLCGYTDISKILYFLAALKTWENCMSHVIEIISRDADCPPDQVREALNFTIKKLKALREFKPKRNFSGNVFLFKSHNSKGTYAEDNINKYCDKPVEVECLEESHEGILENEESLIKIKDIIVRYMKLYKY